MKNEGEVNMILDFCKLFNTRNAIILEKFVILVIV